MSPALGIEQVAVRTLRMAVIWTQVRTAHAGGVSASLIVDQVPAAADEVGRWLDILVTVGILARLQRVGGAWMYASRAPLTLPSDSGRPLDAISPREWWAAVDAAQLQTGTASATQIAALLDAACGAVDRMDVVLKLSAGAAAGLLCLHAEGGHWHTTHRGRLVTRARREGDTGPAGVQDPSTETTR